MNKLIYEEDTYKIIGICMEVHNELGKGFSEVVYGDALEIELIDNNIPYSRESKFDITYKCYKCTYRFTHKANTQLFSHFEIKSWFTS